MTARAYSKAVDAKRNKVLILHAKHLIGAVRFSPTDCFIAKSGPDNGFDEARVWKNVFLGRVGNKWFRYSIDAEVIATRKLFDAIANPNGVWPVEGIRIVLKAPKGVRTQEYRRGQAMKEMRKASAEKNKGKPKRQYRKDDGTSLRSGTGKWIGGEK
jgi:hypothetical protein